MKTNIMSQGHIEVAITAIGLPASYVCSHLAMISIGTGVGDIYALLCFVATSMVIIVNLDKFLEKIRKYYAKLQLMINYAEKYKKIPVRTTINFILKVLVFLGVIALCGWLTYLIVKPN